MASPAQPEDDGPEPLDPAAERVRRKLVRFMGINLAILFAAVMAVVLAFVYKSVKPEGQEDAAGSFTLPGDGMAEGAIDLPTGARILSQSLGGERLSLHLRLADGAEEIRVYEMRQGRQVARFTLATPR